MMEGDIIKPRPVAEPRLTLYDVGRWLLVIGSLFLFLVPPLFNILPLDLVKRFGFGVVVSLALIFWLLGSLQRNKLTFPRSLLLGGLGLLGLVSLVSTLFASSFGFAFQGAALEIYSSWFFWLVLIATFLTSVFFQSAKQVFRWYSILFTSFALIFVFQIFHLFYPAATKWSHLVGGAGNLLGSWSDLGFFFGFITLSLFLILEFFDLSSWRHGRLILGLLVAASLLGTAFTGMIFAWWILAIIALILFIQSFISHPVSSSLSSPLKRPSAILLLISVLFLIFAYSQNILNEPLAKWYQATNIQLNDARPSWGATWSIFNQTLKEDQAHFWLGAGPNGFAEQWAKHRPLPPGPDPFADFEFESGFSFLTTQVVNLGVVGVLAWLTFLLLLCWTIVASWRSSAVDPTVKAGIKLISFGVIYLWISLAITLPGSALIVLTFLMTGILIGFLTSQNLISSYRFVFSRQAISGSLSVILIVALLIVGLLNFYFLARNSFAWWRYGSIVEGISQGQSAEASLGQLLSLRQIHHNEIFDRFVITTANARILELTRSDLPADALRANLQTVISVAIEVAERSISSHPDNYANWLALGSIYETLVPFKVERALESAEQAYLQVAKLNPRSGGVMMNLVRLYSSSGDTAKARSTVEKILEIQPFFTPAIITAAQFEMEDTQISKALNRLEKATLASPNDARLWFALGYLRYQVGRYELSLEALNQAVRYNPTVPEFRYFLGLALGKTGDRAGALRELNLVLSADPNNQNIKDAINNLQK